MISDKSTIIAICPPDYILEAFDAYTDDTVKVHGLHMTLATLGDLKDEDVAKCIAIIHETAQKLKPIHMTFEGEGYLKSPDGRYALIALANAKGLDMWRYELAFALQKENLLNSEIDGFLPHITLSFSENNDRLLPKNFGFKAFNVDCVYFLRGPDMKIQVPIGGKDVGHTSAERKLSTVGGD